MAVFTSLLLQIEAFRTLSAFRLVNTGLQIQAFRALSAFRLVNTGCPTRYRTRHFFDNSNTNEDIATKFEQEYVLFFHISYTVR